MAEAITGATATSPPPPRVVMLASPGAGHLIPLIELARRLVADQGLAVTIVTLAAGEAPVSDTATDAAVLSSLAAASVSTAVLHPVPLHDLADVGFGHLMFEIVRRSIPHLRALVLAGAGGASSTAAIVCDFFSTPALALAAELGVPGYVFLPTSLAFLSVVRRVAVAAGAGRGECRGLPDPVLLHGDVSLRHADVPDGFRDVADPNYGYVIEEGRRYGGADGFLVNSFTEMEPDAAAAFRRDAEIGAFPPVFLVGPIVRTPISDQSSASACMEWLDGQPAASVVFVSFGTSGALSVSQTRELAAGLEMSGHGFLWVVRMPSMDGNPYAFGGGGGGDGGDPMGFLPDGFVERTRGRGLAVASWAPQVRVLEHGATAAFVSHCGWNSTLESVSAGVPVIAWPLYAEQRLNAVVLTELAGVALRPSPSSGGGDGVVVVSREEIAAVVKEVMDPNGEKGRAVRRRAMEMKEAAARAWSPEHGASRRALEEVAGKWRNGVRKD